MFYVQLPSSFQSFLETENNSYTPLFGNRQETPYMWDVAWTDRRKLQLANDYLQVTRMKAARLNMDCDKVAELIKIL